MHGFLAQPGILGIMCFFHCPGSNSTITRFCRETDNTRFLGHLRAFVANQVLLHLRVLLGLFCPDFYSDIEDFTQILCRYLPKKLAAKTSVCNRYVGVSFTSKPSSLTSKTQDSTNLSTVNSSKDSLLMGVSSLMGRALPLFLTGPT